jgi:hypothetical protein
MSSLVQIYEIHYENKYFHQCVDPVTDSTVSITAQFDGLGDVTQGVCIIALLHIKCYT